MVLGKISGGGGPLVVYLDRAPDSCSDADFCYPRVHKLVSETIVLRIIYTKIYFVILKNNVGCARIVEKMLVLRETPLVLFSFAFFDIDAKIL